MKFEYNGRKFYIHKTLANQLDSIVYNLKGDWDFVIIITGDRMVRVGKSVLAQIICAYLGYRINQFISKDVNYTIKDIYFDHEVMTAEAQKKPQYSIDHYDEGREGLAAMKAMTKVQKDLMDFLNESGQLNHVLVVVLPDFFELTEQMAVARSELLINVYRMEEKKLIDMYGTGEKLPIVEFKRGGFEFFSRQTKAALYDEFKKTRRKKYSLVKADFIGDFYNDYAVDEQEYRQKKRDALARFAEKKKNDKNSKTDIFRDRIILQLHNDGLTQSTIAEILADKYSYSIDRSQIGRIISKYSKLESEG